MSEINNVIGIEVRRRLMDIEDLKKLSALAEERSLTAEEKSVAAEIAAKLTKEQLVAALADGDQLQEVLMLRVDPETQIAHDTAADMFAADQVNKNKRMGTIEDNLGNKDELPTEGDSLTKKALIEFNDRGHNIRWNKDQVIDGDWTTAIQTMYDSLVEGDTLYVPKGKWLISNLIFDKTGVNLDIRGTFIQREDASEVAVQIGKDNEYTRYVKVLGVLRVEREIADWSKDTTGVKLLNLYESEMTLGIKRFKQGTLLAADAGHGTVYNNINLLQMFGNKITLDMYADESDPNNKGWVNENTIISGRFGWTRGTVESLPGESREDAFNRLGVIHIHIPSKYMNNNTFYSPSLEGLSGKFIYCNGQYNTFYSPRLEGGAIKVHWGADSIYNQIIFPYFTDFSDETYIDEGTRNKIFGTDFILADRTLIKGGSLVVEGNPNSMSQYVEGDGLVDVRSTRSDIDKLFRGRNTKNEETSFITGAGDVHVRELHLNNGLFMTSGGRLSGHWPLVQDAYTSHGIKIAAIKNTSGAPASNSSMNPGMAVLNTADSKIYFYFGGNVWKGIELS